MKIKLTCAACGDRFEGTGDEIRGPWQRHSATHDDLLTVIVAALDEHEDNERRWLAHAATRSREPFVWKRERHQAARSAIEVATMLDELAR